MTVHKSLSYIETMLNSMKSVQLAHAIAACAEYLEGRYIGETISVAEVKRIQRHIAMMDDIISKREDQAEIYPIVQAFLKRRT